MRFGHLAKRSLAILALALAAAGSLGASTFRRAGLESLAANSDSIVVAEALGSHSYWSADHSFILTDVNLRISETIKGNAEIRQVVVTLLGGTVGDLSTLIVGGAVLRPGGSYLLFLGGADLPGARGVLTVKDHGQGVFEIAEESGELRARSQAAAEHLVPDAGGESRPAGGEEGFELGEMIRQLRDIEGRNRETRQ